MALNAAALTDAQMSQALTEGARLSGRVTQQAAMHLLSFTALPGRSDFARHVDLAEEQTTDGRRVVAAYVRDWRALLGDQDLRLTGGDERLVCLAASWARGVPVDLSARANGLGTAYAKRVIESVIIGFGMTGFYAVQDGPELAKLYEFRASMELENTQGPA